MILNPADGSISGSPLVEAEEAEYTIIAENKAGSVSSTVVIRVRLQDQTDAHARTWEERDATYADANIFCKIARGEIPCRKLYEDDSIIAFLDIAPAARGHTVVTTKNLHQSLDVVPENTLALMGTTIPKLAVAICNAVGAKDYNIVSNNGFLAGQTVFNVHFHIIPRFENDGISLTWASQSFSDGEMDELASKIASSM